MSPRRRGRRGTTLAELLVYLGLLTSGLLVLAGLERGARGALRLQHSLIDIELQASTLLGGLRRDVEAARQLSVDRGALLVVRHDGRAVRYEQGRRVTSGPGVEGERAEAFPMNTSLQVSLEAPPGAPPLVAVEATFAARGGDGAAERRFRRTASPRGEVGR